MIRNTRNTPEKNLSQIVIVIMIIIITVNVCFSGRLWNSVSDRKILLIDWQLIKKKSNFDVGYDKNIKQ